MHTPRPGSYEPDSPYIESLSRKYLVLWAPVHILRPADKKQRTSSGAKFAFYCYPEKIAVNCDISRHTANNTKVSTPINDNIDPQRTGAPIGGSAGSRVADGFAPTSGPPASPVADSFAPASGPPGSREEDSFWQLIRDNSGILYKIANSYCRNREDRPDLLQEMVYQLWKSRLQFNHHFKFSTWMYRIALNVAISFYRTQTRSGVRLSLDGEFNGIELEDIPPEQDAMEEKIGILRRFIEELNDLDKALMILYLEERPHREIAEILGLSESNVSTKLGRIKERLKQRFLTLNDERYGS